MILQEALGLFVAQVKATPILEWIAIAAAVAEVLLARANKVLLYPAGLISTLIYTYIFLLPTNRLYAESILNIYYFVMSIYGWVLWGRRNKGAELAITTASKKDWRMIVVFAVGGWAALYVMLTLAFPYLIPNYKMSDVALWDAFISAMAWVGMWLLARRKVENWLLLNISNLVAIPLYVSRGMPFTAGLTLFLFIVAIFGYLEWKKKARLLPVTA